MKYILTIVSALVLCASCAEKTKEDVIKDTFKEYVKTDFDDPNDFIEVTKIEAIDTLNKADVDKVLQSLDEIRFILSEEESPELYPQFAEYGTSEENWYVINEQIIKYINGKRIN